MKEITKITIKSTSGFGPVEEFYKDILKIKSNSISYEYLSKIETEINPKRSWSYKTTSPIFKKLFNNLAKSMTNIINRDIEISCLDAGSIEFSVTYSDKTRWKKIYFLSNDYFIECFDVIKQMVPNSEYLPAVLVSEDDFRHQE